MDIEVTLLSKEEIEGKSEVLQKVGIDCGSYYWTSTPSHFSYWNFAYEFFVNSTGTLSYELVHYGSGVRPVMKSDNLNELIKNCKSEMKGGIQIVEYGQFPHLYEETEINNPSFLMKTGKTYSLPPQDGYPEQFNILSCQEYYYKDQKVIKLGDRYYPIKPVTWYIDCENNMLISTEVLFSSPINVDNKNYNGDFETSQLYEYLNNQFIKELKPEKIENLFDDEQAETPNPYNLNIEDVDEEDIIEGAILSDIPVMLHGQTGDGKSARVKQIDPNTQIIYLSSADPTDICGKSVQKENLDYLIDYPPTWYVKAKEIAETNPDKIHVIFFDEITNADPLIQGMVFNIVLDREVNGKWKLPDNIRIVAAGNEEDESLSAHKLSAPLFSRFAHVYIKTNREKWLRWANNQVDENGKALIHPAIYAYIAYKGDEVLRTEYNGEKPNADPRKWEMASKILNKTGKADMLRALIGPELTYDFKNFITQKVITLEDVLNDNYKDIDMDISSKYACIANLTRVDEKNVKKVREFVSQLGPEFLSTFDSMWIMGSDERLEIIAALRMGGKQI